MHCFPHVERPQIQSNPKLFRYTHNSSATMSQVCLSWPTEILFGFLMFTIGNMIVSFSPRRDCRVSPSTMETSQWEWGLHLCLKAKEYDIISSKGLSSCSTGHLRGLTDKSYWFGGPIAFRTSPVEESNSCKGEFSILTPDLEKQQFQALELTAHRVFSILILIIR